MAAYSENREHNLEIKYLRKVLGQVDEQIVLPDSLRGDALLARLDGVEQKPPPMRVALVRPHRWLNARSGLAYAAAFLLMVGLFYGLGFDKQSNLVDGTITLDREQGSGLLPQTDTQPLSRESVSAAPEASAGDSTPSEEDIAGQPEASSASAAQAASFAAASDPSASGEPAEPSPLPMEGVGGIRSTQLCTFGEHMALAYRPADANDPELGASHLLEIQDLDGNRLIALMALPAMDRVLYAFAGENLAAVVGEDDHSAYLLILDLFHLEEPRILNLLERPGHLSAVRAFEQNLRMVTYLPRPFEEEGVDTLALPNSNEAGTMLFTALSLEDGSYRQLALHGAGEEINLYNRSAYVYYSGTLIEGEQEKSDLFVAQIRFQDLEMELAGVS